MYGIHRVTILLLSKRIAPAGILFPDKPAGVNFQEQFGGIVVNEEKMGAHRRRLNVVGKGNHTLKCLS